MKRYFMLALAGFALTACGREELPEPATPDARGGELQFQIGIAAPERPGRQQAGLQTRVATDMNFKCAWEAGDAIGIFAVKEGADVPPETYYIRNAKLTYDGSAWTSDTPLYWPGDGRKLRFYACYPYNATDGVKDFDFAVKEDQSADTEGTSNLSLSDLMLTSSDWTAWGQPVDLQFTQHHMCLIELKLDDHFQTIGPADKVSVVMRGVARKGSFAFRSSAWSALAGTDAGQIVMRRVEQPGDADYNARYTFRAIVPMQLRYLSGESLFRIRIGASLLDGSKLTSDFDVSPGNAYQYIEKLYQWRNN